MDYVDFGHRVRKQRVAQKMTQDQLAQKIEVSTSFIGHVERGSRKASIETLVALANALGVGTDYLLGASLAHLDMGPDAGEMSEGQLAVMQEMLVSMQNYLNKWNADKASE